MALSLPWLSAQNQANQNLQKQLSIATAQNANKLTPTAYRITQNTYSPSNTGSGITANYRPGVSGGKVLGQSTSAPINSNPNYGTDMSYFGQMSNAAGEQRDAELDSLNTQFDYLRAQAQNQLDSLGREKTNSLASLNTQLAGLQSNIGRQKTGAMENQETQIAQAGDTARNTQRVNRNTLRALGILDSSAAGELLTRPMNEFDTQRGNIAQATTKRIYELDDWMNQKTDEHRNLVGQLENQYLSLVGNIQNDLRFNDRQRKDAIKAVNASLSDKLAQIGMAQQTYQQQVNAQKAQWVTQLAGINNYQMSQADLAKIMSSTPQLQASNAPQTVGVDQRKKTLYEA